jgi:hypothetical protein
MSKKSGKIKVNEPAKLPDPVVKEVGVTSNLNGELGLCIEMCNKILRHSDFDGIDADGTDDCSVAYSRIQSAIVRLKIAGEKLK